MGRGGVFSGGDVFNAQRIGVDVLSKSNRYYIQADGRHTWVCDGDNPHKLNGMALAEVARRLNDGEDLLYAARDLVGMHLHRFPSLQNAVDAFKPTPKTTEQLLQERLDAADAYIEEASTSRTGMTRVVLYGKYSDAKAAHEASKS